MTVRMSEEEYEKLQQQCGNASEQLDIDDLRGPSADYDRAVAIDPGTDTGLAYTDGDQVVTETSDFWGAIDDLMRPAGVLGTIPHDQIVVILEAPYKSRQSMGRKPAIAYNSGGVAREAELMAERLSEKFEVVEHDPSRQGKKWDSQAAHHFIDQWDGPDNEHVRDALRLLFFYNFI